MRNRIVKVTEVVVRSAFYIISNYVFVSMGLSFHTQWISILFLLSMVWSTIDYGKSINEIIEIKVFAEILCICCIAMSIAMAYFVGYIQGAFVSLYSRSIRFPLKIQSHNFPLNISAWNKLSKSHECS